MLHKTNLWQSFDKVMILLHDENIQKHILKGKEARQRFGHFVDLKNNEDTYGTGNHFCVFIQR
jgi:hypothetical protein